LAQAVLNQSITLAMSIIGTIVIAFIAKAVVSVQPTAEAGQQDLDITTQREEGTSSKLQFLLP